MCVRALLCFAALLSLGVHDALAQTAVLPRNVIVRGGEQPRVDGRVFCQLPESIASQSNLRLMETTLGQNKPTLIQRDARLGGIWWLASGETEAGEVRRYRLEVGEASSKNAVEIRDTSARLEVRAGEQLLLSYNQQHVEPAEGVDPRVGRSAHLHPVWTPGGAIVTDEFPPDHLHQSGLFLAYTKTKFAGRDVDFWNLGGGKGRVRFKRLASASSGAVFGEFQTEHEHVDLTAAGEPSELGKTSGGLVALREQWTARVWRPNAASGYWLLDIASRQECATENPLVLPEYHYGGMAIRAAREWTPGKVSFLTSEGDERIKGNHTRPRWCDIRGEVGGKPAGVALMTHPANYRFPEPLRIHPTMPYMVYTPQFLGAFEIAPGTPHLATYRNVMHDGALTAEALESIWRDFAEPLTAQLE